MAGKNHPLGVNTFNGNGGFDRIARHSGLLPRRRGQYHERRIGRVGDGLSYHRIGQVGDRNGAIIQGGRCTPGAWYWGERTGIEGYLSLRTPTLRAGSPFKNADFRWKSSAPRGKKGICSSICNLQSAIINHTEIGLRIRFSMLNEKMFFTSIFCGSLFCGSAVHILNDLTADSSRLRPSPLEGPGLVFFVASLVRLL